MPAREFAVIFFCSRSLPARRMGVQSAGRQNVARHKCWALTWGNNNNERRQDASVVDIPYMRSRSPSLLVSLSLSLCLDMCDPNVPLFVNSYKSPSRTQCDHCASKRRNKPTTRIGTDCAKPSEREMERGRRTKNKTRAQNGHINKFN